MMMGIHAYESSLIPRENPALDLELRLHSFCDNCFHQISSCASQQDNKSAKSAGVGVSLRQQCAALMFIEQE